MANLAEMLTKTVADHGERIAIKLDDLELSYSLIDQASARAAGLLAAKGVEAGDRVGVMLPNVPYFPFVFFGALRLGAVVVPMNPLLKGREVGFQMEDAGAKVMLGWHQMGEAAREGSESAGIEPILVEPGDFEGQLGAAEPVDQVVDRADDDTAIILYTSGTTGTPKGAQLTHGNLLSATRIAADLVNAQPDGVTFGALPLFHVFGLTTGLTTSTWVGAELTLLPRFDVAKALEMIQRDRVTTFLGVPTMYAAMVHHPDASSFDTSSLELCVSGGAAMPVEVLKAFEQTFDCKVLEGYGLSETCAIGSFNRPDIERKPGSIGIPVDGVEMRLADSEGNDVPEGEVGEILIRGPVVMKGYWNRPEETAAALDEDGWLKTGDLARRDRGRLLLHRRPQEGADHPRRVQHLSPRDRRGPLRAPLNPGGRSRRHPARQPRRGGRRGCRADARRRRDTRGRPELRQGAGRRLQVPTSGVVRRGAAQGSHGQDPQAGDPPAGVARAFDDLSSPRSVLAEGVCSLVEESIVDIASFSGRLVEDASFFPPIERGRR